MSEAIIHAQVTEWSRSVRTERSIDERRLAVSAHLPRDTDPRNTGLVWSDGRKVEDIAIHMSIINLQPQTVAGPERTLPPSGIGLVHLIEPDPEDSSPGSLAELEPYLNGWLGVGPTTFAELWAAANRPLENTTLELWIGPVETGPTSVWTWDPENALFIMSASFNFVTAKRRPPSTPKRSRWW
jgi:hypothetical protein